MIFHNQDHHISIQRHRLEYYETQGLAKSEGERWRLTERAWLVSDDIFSELFM